VDELRALLGRLRDGIHARDDGIAAENFATRLAVNECSSATHSKAVHRLNGNIASNKPAAFSITHLPPDNKQLAGRQQQRCPWLFSKFEFATSPVVMQRNAPPTHCCRDCGVSIQALDLPHILIILTTFSACRTSPTAIDSCSRTRLM
jgi:hypothetical protein